MREKVAERLLFWEGALAIGFITPSFVSIDPVHLVVILLFPCIVIFAWYTFLHSPQIDKQMLAITLFFTAIFSLMMWLWSILWLILFWLPIVMMYFLKRRLDRSSIDTIMDKTILLSFSLFCLGMGMTFGLYGNEISITYFRGNIILSYCLLVIFALALLIISFAEYKPKSINQEFGGELEDQLEDLKERLNTGIITQEEYERKKKSFELWAKARPIDGVSVSATIERARKMGIESEGKTVEQILEEMNRKKEKQEALAWELEDQLKELKEQLDRGTITKEEYEQKKKLLKK